MATGTVRVAFDIPPDLEQGFKQFTERVRKHVVKQSIRSAIRPARTVLRARLMGLSSVSAQSTGASMRAVDTKVKQSKINPTRFYGLVGVNKKYMEALVPEASPVFPNAIQRQVSAGVFTGVNRKTGQALYAKRFKRGDVQNRARRRYGLRKRIPNKYWHLSEKGFRHAKSGYVFPGHNLIEEVAAQTKEECVRIFIDTFRKHFKNAIK